MKSQVPNIQQNIPLAPYTTFKIGGPARYFAEASSEEELIDALQYAKDNNLKIFILGGGSNVLVSDQGFDGLVIKLKEGQTKAKPLASQRLSLEAQFWAGESLASLVSFCAKNSLTGLEWAAGIPGTVGGAVRGNAGAGMLGGPMSINIESVKILDISDENEDLKFKILKNNGCGFDYRESVFKHNLNLIIVSALLELKKGRREEIENKIKEIIEKRKGKFPEEPSPGSFFKNPVIKKAEIIDSFEKDTGLKMKDDKIPAGWLIDQAELRGKKIGGAMVSEKHANFIVNTGQATAQDVIMLISLVKQQVRDKFGIELKEEVQYVGF